MARSKLGDQRTMDAFSSLATAQPHSRIFCSASSLRKFLPRNRSAAGFEARRRPAGKANFHKCFKCLSIVKTGNVCLFSDGCSRESCSRRLLASFGQRNSYMTFKFQPKVNDNIGILVRIRVARVLFLYSAAI